MSVKLKMLMERYFKQDGSVDALLISNGVNRRYLLGFGSSAGTLVVLPEKAYFIIDFRYIEAARKTVSGCEVILQDKLYDQISQLLSLHQVKTVGVEDDRLTLTEFSEYREKLSQFEICSGCGLSQTLAVMRMIKSEDEILKLEHAQKIAEKAFIEILDFIRPGVTEKQIAARLEYAMKLNGAEDLSFETIAVAGKNTSLPHGVPSEYKVEKGDFITMDFGAVIDGYHSDMTRTVAVGSISKEQQKVYDIVLKAQMMALDEIKVGAVCSEIDRVARDYINQMGYEGCFGHGLGHSVGVEIHEEPRFSPSCDIVLENNMVMTVEPGIYLQGKFGVRIEDFVVIRNNCVQNLIKSQKNLICL